LLPFADKTEQTRRAWPLVTASIVAANVAVFAYMLFLSPEELAGFVRSYGVVPRELIATAEWLSAGPYWAILGSMFVHSGIVHLLGNMIFLWVFGDTLETALGHLTYLLIYLLAGIAATTAHVLTFPASGTPLVGASGAIAGLLGGYLILFPRAQVRVLLFFGPFYALGRVAALFVIFGWFVLQVFRGAGSINSALASDSGVAYVAHIAGFLVGLTATAAVRQLRHQPLGRFSGRFALSWTFRNWLLIVLLLAGLSLVSAATSGGDANRMRTFLLSAAAVVATADGSLRVLQRRSLLGEGRGLGRWVALLQVLAALGLLAAILLG
jgi:membrane associated rhomboid family serine protease